MLPGSTRCQVLRVRRCPSNCCDNVIRLMWYSVCGAKTSRVRCFCCGTRLSSAIVSACEYINHRQALQGNNFNYPSQFLVRHSGSLAHQWRPHANDYPASRASNFPFSWRILQHHRPTSNFGACNVACVPARWLYDSCRLVRWALHRRKNLCSP